MSLFFFQQCSLIGKVRFSGGDKKLEWLKRNESNSVYILIFSVFVSCLNRPAYTFLSLSYKSSSFKWRKHSGTILYQLIFQSEWIALVWVDRVDRNDISTEMSSVKQNWILCWQLQETTFVDRNGFGLQKRIVWENEFCVKKKPILLTETTFVYKNRVNSFGMSAWHDKPWQFMG